MKTVILAGGLGTRLSEETLVKPKPMVEIGGKPILWHIMKIYSFHGVCEFIVCLGYKGYMIKEYFANYFLHTSDVTFDMSKNQMRVHHVNAESWTITLIDTGDDTMTGGRLKRVRDYLPQGEFFMTYGDGVGDIDISASLRFHRSSGTLATVTATRPPARFGALNLNGDKVVDFKEKPESDSTWINGGFFVLKCEVLDYIDGDGTIWEREPMERLAMEGQLSAFRHFGFWRPMDTLRDRMYLEELWGRGQAPWKTWS